jgi:proprotein convertase subtilisin/kexin type 5
MVAGVQYYLDSGICKAICPALTFGGLDVNSKPVCISCDGTCATCNGTASTNCLSCPGSTYLKYQGSACVSPCDDGQFASNNNLCALCSSNCKTCVTSATNCQTCGSSPAGITLYLYSAACIAVCPDTYYADSSSYQCKPCNSSCHTCSGSLSTNCLTCTSGSLRASDNTCQSSCPNGQYSQSNVCYPCKS